MAEEASPADSRDPQPRQNALTTGGGWRGGPRWPRTWPDQLRLMAVLVLLGACAGMATFLTRGAGAQANLPFARPGTVRHALPVFSVGPGTPTPDVYQSDPFTPPPAPTHAPTHVPTVKPTPTTNPVRLQVTLSPSQAHCDTPTTQLAPVTLTLDNSRSQVAVRWTLTLGPGPNGTTPWAQANPGTEGTLAAGAAPAGVTLTPDPTLCAQLVVAGQAGQFTAQVTTTPGGQASTQTFTVLPSSGGGKPTPTPTIGVTPSPAPKLATPSPSPTAGG